MLYFGVEIVAPEIKECFYRLPSVITVITRAAHLWPILLIAYFNNTYLTDNDFAETNDSTHDDTYIDKKECNN